MMSICSLISSSPKQFFLLMAGSIVRVIHRLWQSIGEIKKVLWDPDSTKQIHLRFLIFKAFPREQFVYLLTDDWHLQDLVTAWSHLWSDLHQELNRLCKLIRKYIWNFRVNSSQHFFIEALHIFGSERWFESDRLIQNASQRPNIRFVIIRLVTPNFRGCVVRSSRLCVQ